MQVRAHAVEVLKRTENEELLYYLLQLVQALRYEAADDSRLAAFLVQRAISDPTLAIFLHWSVRQSITPFSSHHGLIRCWIVIVRVSTWHHIQTFTERHADIHKTILPD